MTVSSARAARKMVKDWFKTNEGKASYTKLKARRISFVDLARNEAIFVDVYGWSSANYPHLYEELNQLGKHNGFIVSFAW